MYGLHEIAIEDKMTLNGQINAKCFHKKVFRMKIAPYSFKIILTISTTTPTGHDLTLTPSARLRH